MLDRSISNSIKDINNIDSFLEKQAQIKPEVGKAGGRFFSVKVTGKPVEFKMKELIADIHGTVVKESKDPTKAIDPKKVSNILKNLKELDNRGYKKVKTHSLIIRLMTTLRQILGNLGFNKKGMLKDLQTLSNKKVRFNDKTDEIPSTPTLKKKEEVKTKSKKTKQEPAKGKSPKLHPRPSIKKQRKNEWGDVPPKPEKTAEAPNLQKTLQVSNEFLNLFKANIGPYGKQAFGRYGGSLFDTVIKHLFPTPKPKVASQASGGVGIGAGEKPQALTATEVKTIESENEQLKKEVDQLNKQLLPQTNFLDDSILKDPIIINTYKNESPLMIELIQLTAIKAVLLMIKDHCKSRKIPLPSQLKIASVNIRGMLSDVQANKLDLKKLKFNE